jgi:hypothetical protein
MSELTGLDNSQCTFRNHKISRNGLRSYSHVIHLLFPLRHRIDSPPLLIPDRDFPL